MSTLHTIIAAARRRSPTVPAQPSVPALLPPITSPGDGTVLFCQDSAAQSQPVAPAVHGVVDSESDEDWSGRCGK